MAEHVTVIATNVAGRRNRTIPELSIPDLPGAVCKGVEDPDIFFPGVGGGGRKAIKQAKALCATCPVRVKCLDEALNWDREHPDYYDRTQGIWGGTTEAERKVILKKERHAA
ncbi:WhiB family transcription factor [Mycobacterium phage Halena]|uniref:WhiB family transcription factor n=6 Tax=Bronvirus TaxID=1623278 RepID=E0YPL1_9CAUD|nr:WhiB transcriptional factor [Mycobacterium phage LeBron]YP_010101384.1 WhiB transcriptional factor [Mycobacterium phage Silverleaf]AEK07612.1 WhiB family transcription factor [Mycobacterium phage UPIE]AEZ50756.1 hypothetical protein [Mycobacterium phage Fezzik]ASR86061.1 WhiB family transcription factor [Mycobacterium phage Appletree2]AYD82256.1 WhiB family transcription factor [Mycobacterium phage Wamburgrxpress]AZS12233.1 WhiB family transcription factor [Mycobacterium phage Acquire49]Q